MPRRKLPCRNWATPLFRAPPLAFLEGQRPNQGLSPSRIALVRRGIAVASHQAAQPYRNRRYFG
jgi:hypothetical protein